MEPIKSVLNNLSDQSEGLIKYRTMQNFRRQTFKEEEIIPLKREFLSFCRECFYQENGQISLSEDEKKIMALIFNWLIGEGIDTTLNQGLLLTGKFGTGKSVILKAIVKFIDKYYTDKVMTNGITEPVYAMAHDMANSFEEGKVDHIMRMKSTSILAIDDLGYEPHEVKYMGTPAKPFEEVLMSRYDKRKLVLISTNMSMEEIGVRYKGHIFDRLRQMVIVIEFKGSSKR
jgi:hypothetical protein